MDPWLSVALTICLPGLGHFHAGRPWRGLLWFVVAFAAVQYSLWRVFCEIDAFPTMILVIAFVSIPLLLAASVDAFLITRGMISVQSERSARWRYVAISMVSPGLAMLTLLAFGPLLTYAASRLIIDQVFLDPAIESRSDWSVRTASWANLALNGLGVIWVYVRAAGSVSGTLRVLVLRRAVWAALIAGLVWPYAGLQYGRCGESAAISRLLTIKTCHLMSRRMEPVLRRGEFLVYSTVEPVGRGAVVAYDASLLHIGRIVALPGERVRLTRGRAVVNDRPLDEPYLRASMPTRISEELSGWREIVVPVDSYLVLPDNRSLLIEDGALVPTPASDVRGVVVSVYWPLRAMRRIR